MKKLKRALALVLATAILLGLCACGEEMVEVRVPAALYSEDELTDENLQSNVEENGFKSYQINEDGSVTYTMTKSKQQETLEKYKQIVEETNAGLLEGENSFESFERIEYTDDLTQFDVYVNEEYSLFDSLSCMVFYMLGGMYQSFSGVQSDEIQVVVNYIDEESNEVIESADYQKWISKDVSEDAGQENVPVESDDDNKSEPVPSPEPTPEVTPEPTPEPTPEQTPTPEPTPSYAPVADGLTVADLSDLLNSSIDYIKSNYPSLALMDNDGSYIADDVMFYGISCRMALSFDENGRANSVILRLDGKDIISDFKAIDAAFEAKYGAADYRSSELDELPTSFNDGVTVLYTWENADIYIEHSIVANNGSTFHLAGIMTQAAAADQI